MNLLLNETFIVDGEAAMLELGASLSEILPKNGVTCIKNSTPQALKSSTSTVITLEGNLGAGKTTLVRGLLRKLGHTGVVKSPTYTLVEPYHLDKRDIYHFDLYRLGSPDELEYMGFRDYFNEDSVCLLEWPEKGGDFVPPADINVQISIKEQARAVKISTFK